MSPNEKDFSVTLIPVGLVFSFTDDRRQQTLFDFFMHKVAHWTSFFSTNRKQFSLVCGCFPPCCVIILDSCRCKCSTLPMLTQHCERNVYKCFFLKSMLHI